MAQGRLVDEEITRSIIGAFYEVYNTLGFGFVEHVYIRAFERELRARGHQMAREARVRIMYKGELLTSQRLDMVVDEKVVIEIKSTLQLHPSARRQLYNYLRATNLEIGLLLHFGPRPAIYRQICRNPKN